MEFSIHQDQLIYLALLSKANLQNNAIRTSVSQTELINYVSLFIKEAKTQGVTVKILPGSPKAVVSDKNIQAKIDALKFKTTNANDYYLDPTSFDPEALQLKAYMGLPPVVLLALTPNGYEKALGVVNKYATSEEETSQPGEES